MMDDRMLRDRIHRAVEAYGGAVPDPAELRLIPCRAHEKENIRMKRKLSTTAILMIALLLITVAALAVGLTVEEMWLQSFDRMRTTGWINNASDETQAEITLEEAISIARRAIIAKYGTPEGELDAMGVYPSYFARGWDGKTDDYPSEWDIYFSSRTDVDLDLDHTDYGPTGEYRVYINAETKETTYCHWYTNDFWSRAQRVWDCGSYDEVHWHYGRQSFFALPVEQQAYWTAQLASREYRVIAEDERLHEALLAAATDLQFLPLSAIADNGEAQVRAAWAAMAERGLDPDLLQRYAYVATIPDWQTGTDNVCIHYSYELEWDLMNKGFLQNLSDWLFCRVTKLGLYMVSFEPGTTRVIAVTHVPISESHRQEPVTEGSLLTRTDWTSDDLTAFDEAYRLLDRAVGRMQAAGLPMEEQEGIVRSFLRGLGDPYIEAPEAVDAERWFAETSEWDARIPAPAMTYEEFTDRYGSDERFWPMEVLCRLKPENYRMPLPGETTLEEAARIALDHLVCTGGEEALASLGDYQVFCRRVSLSGDPGVVDCRWEVFIVADPANPVHGYNITWGEWEDHADEPDVRHITEQGNG